jgi:predicted aspartyl protease
MRSRLCSAIVAATALVAPAAAEIPLSEAPTGHLTAPVEVNGEPALFVVDTGAEGSAVYQAFARDRHLPASGRQEKVQGQTGAADVTVRTIDRAVLDGWRTNGLHVVELPSRADGVPLAGIIGLDAIGRHVLDFDPTRRRMAVLDAAAGRRLAATLGRPTLARRLRGGLFAVRVRINGVAGWGVIDTGARETRINGRFARQARLRLGTSRDVVHGATQTALMQRSATARRLTFLGKRLANIQLKVADLPVFRELGLAAGPAMLIGIDRLRAHRLVIDISGSRVWLL